MLKQHKMKIMDQTWTFTIWDEEAFADLHNKRDAAITIPSKCTVDFCESDFDLNTCLHEVWHINCKYLYTDSASITTDQQEEIHAEMFADKVNIMKSQAETIYKKLKI